MKTVDTEQARLHSDSAREVNLRILQDLFGGHSFEKTRFRLWDGTFWPDDELRPATVVLNHPGALRAMFHSPSEVTLGEAYLRDDFDVEGHLESAFELADAMRHETGGWSDKLKVAYLLHKLPERSGADEQAAWRRAKLHGRRHSPARDREAITFHYDLSNDFYALWLDQRKAYSCGYFEEKGNDLDTAQLNKLDYICRKLDLRPGRELLDIGCGWGGLVMHAAEKYGVTATGITLSERQAEYAREEVRQRNLREKVEIRVQDYREVTGHERFDAIASVGMVEHVGEKNLPRYFELAYRLLKPGGVFLNHGITKGTVSITNHGPSFIDNYVFPDGELLPIARVLDPAQTAGFEIRNVENLREHYALTLEHWVARLEAKHVEAREFVSEAAYRIWRLYMAGSSHGFKHGHIAVYQTLLAKLDEAGDGRYAKTRSGWYH